MTELLIVVALIALLVSVALMSVQGQIQKAQDSRKKTDLAKISRALELYVNDTGCYPPVSTLATCGGTQLGAYLDKTPCHQGATPYVYVPVNAGNVCEGYRLFARLQNLQDPDIERVGCSVDQGCGNGAPAGFNYGVSSGIPVGQY